MNAKMKMPDNRFIAHRRKDGREQALLDHLNEVGELASKLASKFGVPQAGELAGMLHDMGKFSADFQAYIGSATGKINPDEDEYVEFQGLKGKIDHSTAGAQWVWEHCQKKWGAKGALVGQIIALCIASHHSGLIDCIKPEGDNGFLDRIRKPEKRTHKSESLHNAPKSYLEKLAKLTDKDLIQSVCSQLGSLESAPNVSIRSFYFGFFCRMLFSCLIDADRINSADFEFPDNIQHRNNLPVDWGVAVSRLEEAIANFKCEKPIDELRRNISERCRVRAGGEQGIYTLTVPTGGGKTYASLRYALHHAQKHELDRIIYVIPFTSIIEQNAAAIRQVIDSSEDLHSWVLEQHSSLEPEQQTWHSKLVSENWDAPIVMTTMVQFLEVLFSGGTRGARKMHQLANSVLVFDEIQTLPINCVHLFCNALNYIVKFCHSTAVLCTATQPLLDQLRLPEKGQLDVPPGNELVDDVSYLFEKLQRVNINNKVRPEGWSAGQIAKLAVSEYELWGSCLIIVNTKSWAQKLYLEIQSAYGLDKDSLFLLSTNLCPAHRKSILNEVKGRLAQDKPVLCISTQLIEAGVDIDFASVIRFLAGLDSIAQAAGRCNRNGLRKEASVYVLNPNEERIDFLKDIRVGRDKAQRVMGDGFDDLLAPKAMAQYFKYYFYDRAEEMSYRVSSRQAARNDDLLSLLGSNSRNVGAKKNSLLLQQSFMTAGKIFQAIDSPTQAVIAPYGKEGKRLIAELGRIAKEFNVAEYRENLRQAQKYSVNVFPNVWERLRNEGVVYEIQPGEGIYWLDERYYSDELGLTEESCQKMSALTF